MTTRLLESIKKESFLQPHTVLAERCGFSIETIQNIMDDEIDKYDAMRAANPPQAPRVLGIDEKHICNAMRGTLVDVENGHLIEMLENNKKQTMENGIKSLDGWDTNIKVITTDMNNAYLRWLPDLLPNMQNSLNIFVFNIFSNPYSNLCRSLLSFFAKFLHKSIFDFRFNSNFDFCCFHSARWSSAIFCLFLH